MKKLMFVAILILVVSGCNRSSTENADRPSEALSAKGLNKKTSPSSSVVATENMGQMAVSSVAASSTLVAPGGMSYLSVDFYPVTQDAYGETPINAVLRVPQTSVIGSSNCFDRTTNAGNKESACPAEWLAFTDTCKEQIKTVITQAQGDNEDTPSVVIARISKVGGTAMFVRSYFGGSGGGTYDWSMYLLKWQEKEETRCPFTPFLAGKEVTPGGNVWKETYCGKNESADACAERIFYPKGNASRLEFGANGTRLSIIPIGAKLPEDNSEKYW